MGNVVPLDKIFEYIFSILGLSHKDDFSIYESFIYTHYRPVS